METFPKTPAVNGPRYQPERPYQGEPERCRYVYWPNLVEAKIRGPERYYKRDGRGPPSYAGLKP